MTAEKQAKRYFEILSAQISAATMIGFAWVASYFGASDDVITILFVCSLIELFIALINSFRGDE